MAATAATCASENLRPLIYLLVEKVLDKTSEEGRLYYILDTLDHCPYDNLKVAVIGTLKKQVSGAKNVSPPISEDFTPDMFPVKSSTVLSRVHGLLSP
jgi:Uncharacterised protein family, YAP/Alf4/glomulin